MQKVKQQKRDLIEEFRSWAREHNSLWQTQFPDKSICVRKWLFDNIYSITLEHQYAALEQFVNYYGIERNEMIALFDYCSKLELSTVDWKTQEINDYASFIMTVFPFVVLRNHYNTFFNRKRTLSYRTILIDVITINSFLFLCHHYKEFNSRGCTYQFYG